MAKVLYIAHGLHANGELTYKYSKSLGEDFKLLPHFYIISLIRKHAAGQEVRATILVKSDLEQTSDNFAYIYKSVVQHQPELSKLPQSDYVLRCVRGEMQEVPEVEEVIDVLRRVYAMHTS